MAPTKLKLEPLSLGWKRGKKTRKTGNRRALPAFVSTLTKRDVAAAGATAAGSAAGVAGFAAFSSEALGSCASACQAGVV